MKFSSLIYSLLFIGGYCCASTIASTAEESTYTEPENKALTKLRKLVKDQLYQDYMHRDEYLIPWLRAKKLDVNQARDMLVRALNWRKENKMDSIDQEKFPQFEDGFKFDTQGRDKDGRPVQIVLMGTWNFRKVVLAGEIKNMTRYMIKVLLEQPSQRAREIGKANGSNSTQIVLIIDMSGFNLRQHACIACLPAYFSYIQTFDNYYPQFFKEAIGVNMPSTFNTVIDLTKPFWSDYFTKHIQFHGYNKNEYRPVLTRFISPDQLPVQFGGTNTRKIG